MEARVCSILLLSLCYFAFGAGYRTENFTVRGRIDARYAKQIGEAAEVYRRELAKKWLGHELPAWRQRCPIEVVLKRHAEGRTSFAFHYAQNGQRGQSTPGDWDMMIAGPSDRILDAVLPHEITHTIFATHFGQPLPRWADEGACTTVEHISERQKNHRMLIEFLTTDRGIPFNQMFRMKEYPRDILPLYAQGYSLARYFIEQKGHRHFISYLEKGMATEDWDTVTQEFYGHEDLSDLQISWIGWIKDGCPKPDSKQLDQKNGAENEMIADASLARVERPMPPVSSQHARRQVSGAKVDSTQLVSQPIATPPARMVREHRGQGGASAQQTRPNHDSANLSQSWYVQQMELRTNGAANAKQGRETLKAESQDSRANREHSGQPIQRQPNQNDLSLNESGASNRSKPKIVCSGGTCRIIR